MAKSVVTKSIAAYDAAVVTTSVAWPEGHWTRLNYANYVPLGNSELTDPNNSTTVVTITNGMASVNLNQLIQYANANLNIDPQVATVTEDDDELTTDMNEGGVTNTDRKQLRCGG